MKTASIRLIIDKNDSDIPMVGVTPAEVQVLCMKHSAFVGKIPIKDLKEGEDVKRSDMEEVRRLSRIHGGTFVQGLFGKVNPRLPANFKDAIIIPQAGDLDVDTVLPEPEVKATKDK